jgi:hypothetical protein
MEEGNVLIIITRAHGKINFSRAHLDFPTTITPLEQFRNPSVYSYSRRRRKKRQLKLALSFYLNL